MLANQALRRRIGDSSKPARHALVLAENRNAIAFELRAMLDARGWTQLELAERAGMKQAVISKYVSGYDNYSLSTLRRLGEALDVALLVSYVPFSEFIDRMTGKSPASLAVPDVMHDPALVSNAPQMTARTLANFPFPSASTTPEIESDSRDAGPLILDHYRSRRSDTGPSYTEVV